MNIYPAGVAYTHPTMGYQTVNLGFAVEPILGEGAILPGGVYPTGIADRVNLVGNVMEYFEKAPSGTPTGADEGDLVARVSCAHPNPFGPSTTISYVVPSRGHVAVRVYDPAGRLVATLVNGSVEPGEHAAVWDGTTDSGERAASGVYFYRLAADERVLSKKMVLLK